MTGAQFAALNVLRKYVQDAKVSFPRSWPGADTTTNQIAAQTTVLTTFYAALSTAIGVFNTAWGSSVISVPDGTPYTGLSGALYSCDDVLSQLAGFQDTLGNYPIAVQNAATSGADGYMLAADKAKLDAFPAYAARSFANTPSRTIQTVAAAANGWRIDTTRDSLVSYSVSIAAVLNAGAVTSGYVAVEIAATNSVTAGDWTEVGRFTNTPSGAMIATFAATLLLAGCLSIMVPGGYYVRLRSVNVAGTPTYAFLSGQEVKL